MLRFFWTGEVGSQKNGLLLILMQNAAGMQDGRRSRRSFRSRLLSRKHLWLRCHRTYNFRSSILFSKFFFFLVNSKAYRVCHRWSRVRKKLNVKYLALAPSESSPTNQRVYEFYFEFKTKLRPYDACFYFSFFIYLFTHSFIQLYCFNFLMPNELLSEHFYWPTFRQYVVFKK